MAQYQRVKPGDLITAELMNKIMVKIEQLEERVTELESSGGGTVPSNIVKITSFEPEVEAAAGQELVIHGTNFAFPPGNNTVTIDGEEVTNFLSPSSYTRLRLIIPDTITVPPGGKNTTVSIENANGSDQALYRVLPAVPVMGEAPDITGVTNADGSSQPLKINDFASITGENFAGNPTENRISFIIDDPVAGIVTYPDIAGGEELEIDAANSSTTQIIVRVPDIAEIANIGGQGNVTIEVAVGAHPPATKLVQVIRMS